MSERSLSRRQPGQVTAIGIASLALEGLFLTTAVANVLLGRMRETGERVAASAAVHRDVAA